MSFTFRPALAEDSAAIRALLPRLAAFDIPARRTPEDLWRNDEKALLAWLDGADANGFAHVAVNANKTIVGIIFTRLRKELLSGEPSAHIEALAVADEAEGQGIASQLITIAERVAAERGARTLTLHVFECNKRARRLYERLGYDGELIRFIKDLPSSS
ncbi:MAG: GNAT family N-acetyltransferase [Gammaproteobacteria bacterium]|nr:GNAT family N-acetyltransferase [Gammaproteobacteria bacterium]MDH3768039.1 GNAT family N-acetyltransferase [Gammaproteobacteria bacterium]